MGIFSKLSASADLVNGMADRLGADMADLLGRDPEMQGPKLRTMVLRCSSCEDQGACARLQASGNTLATAPDYCQNKTVMDVVARR